MCHKKQATNCKAARVTPHLRTAAVLASLSFFFSCISMEKKHHWLFKLWQDEFLVKAKGPQRCAGNPLKATLPSRRHVWACTAAVHAILLQKSLCNTLVETHVRNVLTPTRREHYQTCSNCCATLFPTQRRKKVMSEAIEHLDCITMYKRGNEKPQTQVFSKIMRGPFFITYADNYFICTA